MIRFSLICDHEHEFEAWFRNNDDFDRQKKRGFVECPECGSSKVEKALMAPKPEGFNLWGYLLPGSAILLAGGALAAFISRRKVAVAQAEAAPAPASPSLTVSDEPTAPPRAQATPEELDRLRRALAEVED